MNSAGEASDTSCGTAMVTRNSRSARWSKLRNAPRSPFAAAGVKDVGDANLAARVVGLVSGVDRRQRRVLERDFAIGGVGENVETKRLGLLDPRPDRRRVGEFTAAAHQLPTASKVVGA